MNSHSEDLYLEAEQAIKDSNFIEAKRIYEEILEEDPRSACTHNSMGWLYKTQFDNYDKAERHYQAAIRYEPSYPHSYWNLAYLYNDLERWDELRALMKQCLSVPTVDKSLIYNRIALMEEQMEHFEKASQCYRKASLLCVSDERLEEFGKAIKRCEYKMELLNASDGSG